MSYLQQRVFQQMGLAPEQCKIDLYFQGVVEGDRRLVPGVDIFSADKDDNIRTIVYGIDRQVVEYIPENTGQTALMSDSKPWTPYYVTRLHPDRCSDGCKYVNPKGMGTYPFFPPALVAAYEAKQDINTLFITEGYFKAMQASVAGLPIVGVTGIHNVRNKQKQLHPDIWKLIRECNVRNVAFIYDGDCANISTKALEAKEDLRKRPYSFLQAGLNFKECFATSKVNAYWVNILSDQIENQPKGLDDLLLSLPARAADIVSELKSLPSMGEFFFALNLTSFSNRLQKHLSINNVQTFYDRWVEVIGTREFIFSGNNYRHNGEQLEKTVPRELKNFFRIGDDFYELIKVPNIMYRGADDDSNYDTRLVRRKKGTITDDFGKDAINKIAKYKSFVNVPSNENYQREIRGCYNMYQEIKYMPEEGRCDTILGFLRHIFQEHIEYGLDYLKLIYERPTQMLPILCLVSEERKTGKDTFLNLLHEIYGDNCRVCGNQEIQSDFNTYFAGKLIVGINETDLSDNRGMTEKLKMWSTAKKVSFTGKGKDSEEIDNFTKYIICSNNVNNFIYTDKNEIRFWIREIQPVTEENPRLLEQMVEEIPQFLYYLKNREMHVPVAKTRSWFDTDVLRTDALKRLIEHQRPKLEIIISDYLREYFLTFKEPTVKHTVQSLKRHINDIFRVEDYKVRKIITERLKKEYAGNSKFSVYSMELDALNNEEYRKVNKYTGRYFEFYARDFLTETELIELQSESHGIF